MLMASVYEVITEALKFEHFDHKASFFIRIAARCSQHRNGHLTNKTASKCSSYVELFHWTLVLMPLHDRSPFNSLLLLYRIT